MLALATPYLIEPRSPLFVFCDPLPGEVTAADIGEHLGGFGVLEGGVGRPTRVEERGVGEAVGQGLGEEGGGEEEVLRRLVANMRHFFFSPSREPRITHIYRSSSAALKGRHRL